MRRAVLLLALCATMVAAAAVSGPAQPTPDPGPAADAELLSRLRTETGASAAIATASWTDYASLVARHVFHWLHESLGGIIPSGSLGFRLAAWALLALLAAGLAIVLFRATVQLLRGRRRRRPRAAPTASTRAAEPASPPRGRDWLAEIERRLSAGDVEGGAAALWWWLATSLAGASVDPTWTSRELLRWTKRPDLSPHAAELDCMLYGPTRPAADDVRRLTSRLAPLLA